VPRARRGGRAAIGPSWELDVRLEVDRRPAGPERWGRRRPDRRAGQQRRDRAAAPQGFLEVTDEMWATTWNLNVMSAVRATRAALPSCSPAAAGRSSTRARSTLRLPDPLVVDYSAAKAALTNFAKSLSKEFGPRGSGSTRSRPGRSPPTCGWATAACRDGRRRAEHRPADVEAGAKAAMVTGRFTRPEEVADLVVLLAGDRIGNTTGAEFHDRRRHDHDALTPRSRPPLTDQALSWAAARRKASFSWRITRAIRPPNSAANKPAPRPVTSMASVLPGALADRGQQVAADHAQAHPPGLPGELGRAAQSRHGPHGGGLAGLLDARRAAHPQRPGLEQRDLLTVGMNDGHSLTSW
jgi:NAD(P)-dependent dehydrogenase (short-subunit alcohol dehydrogenase family)